MSSSAAGVKVTAIWQVPPAAIPAAGTVHFVKLKAPGLAPVNVGAPRNRPATPVLVIVSVWGALDVPLATLPNDSEGALRLRVGVTPLPLTGTACGDPGALS